MKRIVVLIAAAALTLTACGGNEAATGSPSCPNGEVRFGIEPYEDPAKLTPAYEVLTGALRRELNCPVKLQVVQDYSAEVLAMQNGKLELAQFGPLGFVFASRRAGAEPVASFGDAQGKLTSYQAGIWVPKDSPVQSLADLRGKSLALSEPGSTSGDALPRAALAKVGLDKSALKLDYAGGHPEALLALTNGKVDAAEINTQQLATASAAGTFDASRFRQVWASDPIPNDPITVAGSTTPEFKAAVRKALLNLTPAEVAAVGKFLDVDPAGPLVAVDKSTYQPLFDLADTLGLSEGDV
ncbi:phosphate/phosphite/phosphonate ABC transporter substrate-binding protein [Actinokineospora globicatena]|uniref:phosphate/phosphite/phosphonate ABC transporter substrate-binding protein n=1 Tax=Actinokineospora globicatena TaxID=103729 RepID=UPI0020A3DBF9|nr:phosphate/phosphite/phosphonate ABC transporter substrate-binding protein [Actinokineospora globicatena]MCP2300943.1 phosphonate transport system substrate-binding protein [Actinokineospora globicatena]GLW77427.1 putative selenate ABC transporter substrate-binding protein [Actinokineospora globicatena]GLW84261.1 putative selenate ABC transporter substrate-binding protein [Actinokineospora globicatena]